jgi:hypothetical protein
VPSSAAHAIPGRAKNGHIGRSNRYTTGQMRTDMCIDFS